MSKISIIIPTYNHEKYIEECLNSVLNQTYTNFEIIITDDCSADRTLEIAKKFTDPRIKIFSHDQNMGGAYTANSCLKQITGNYIAMLSSDDCWLPDKLEKQLYFLEANPEISLVFTKAEIIDENSRPFQDKAHPYCSIFNQDNRSSDEWLNFFFYKGNCLCHPSALIKKEVYEKIGHYNPCLSLLPDYEFWIRASVHFNIHIIDEKLIQFRVRENEENASGVTPANLLKGRFEHLQVLKYFLDINKSDRLLAAFPEVIKYGQPANETASYFIARLAIDTGIDIYQLWGLQTLSAYLAKNHAQAIAQYNFGFSDLHRLTTQMDIFKINPANHLISSKTKKPFNPISYMHRKLKKACSKLKNKIHSPLK